MKDENAALKYDGKWLYFDQEVNEWIVATRRRYARKNEIMYQGTMLTVALGVLRKAE
jgi:hypothetical protein